MKNNVLIELIINNQCNKRCDYCDLDFRNKKFEKEDLDIFIDFLRKNSEEVNYFFINFFGWEPLLSYEEVKYFVWNVWVENIKYSIGTNGVFLDEEKLEFLKKNNFKIYLSVDNIDGKPFLEKKDFYGYQDMIEVNYINDPDFLYNSRLTLDLILEKGFKNINFMPVFTTKKRDKEKLKDFLILKNYISSLPGLNINYFSYYNGFSSDIQFMLDTDMYFYQDLDSLIWLQKQYSLLPADLKKELHEGTQLFHLGEETFTVKDLINRYNAKKVLELVMKIPKVLGTYQENILIDKILKNGA